MPALLSGCSASDGQHPCRGKMWGRAEQGWGLGCLLPTLGYQCAGYALLALQCGLPSFWRDEGPRQISDSIVRMRSL